MKIKKGDTVKIMAGRDIGKIGKVIKVDRKNATVVVEGLNLVKKHQRPKRQDEKGTIVSIAKAMPASKVMLLCPNCNQATRVGYRLEGQDVNARKNRYCKKCQSLL